MVNLKGFDVSKERLESVIRSVEEATKAAGRTADSVNLIAVSKTFDETAIEPILAAGHRQFGENRVQESQKKWPTLKKVYPDAVLHLIGPLQSNKAADAVALFDVIHTVDRPKIAKALSVEIEKQNRSVEVFIQINTGKEDQKAGIYPEDADSFINECKQVHRLSVKGPMSIPPIDEDAGKHFKMLADIAARNELEFLSMGMSADYAEAIKHGATHIRVGSAVFGARTKPV